MMRIKLHLNSSEQQKVSWQNYLQPGHKLIYQMLASVSPVLKQEIYEKKTITPFCYNALQFDYKKGSKEGVTYQGNGLMEISTSRSDVAAVLISGFQKSNNIKWGEITLNLVNVELEFEPNIPKLFKTLTPTIVLGTTLPGQSKYGRKHYLYPEDEEFGGLLQQNATTKLQLLGIDEPLELISYERAGKNVRYETTRSFIAGAPIISEWSGSDTALRTLYSSGLGQANSYGGGMIQ